jgi:oligopeptide/dipeptide ABC transporter ATP-binding protein
MREKSQGNILEPIFTVDRLCVDAEFKDGNTRIVKGLSFEIAPGEQLAIVGESGCGKTMTAMAIFGLLPPNCRATGSVILDGKNLLSLKEKQINTLRGREIVLIPQSGADFLNPAIKIREQIYETLRKTGIKEKCELQTGAKNLLARVGFDNPEGILEKYPFQLSGGMAQRVVLAIGLAFSPRLVIADEPTRGIDDETAALFIGQLGEMFRDSAIIVITHNISVAGTCRNILVMHTGEMMEYGKANAVLNTPNHPYTRSLIDALPSNGFKVYAATNNEREISKKGCPFFIRCPEGTEECTEGNFPAREDNGTTWRCVHA